MTGVSAGTVLITYTKTNSCGTAIVVRNFTITSPKPGVPLVTGTDVTFSVYPNPTSGQLTIEAPVTGTFSIYTIDGRLMSSYTVKESTMDVQLPSHLTAGFYMCRFNGDDGSTVMVRLVYEP